MKNSVASSRRGQAFTLIELLVATAVLALMVVGLAQLGGITSRSVGEGLRRADNFAKARAALELISQDVAGGVFRPDLAAFRDDGGNFQPAFFSRRTGLGGDRALSLVAYKVDPAAGVLERASLAVPWSDTSGIDFGTATAIPRFANLTAADYQQLSSGIVRLEFFFLDSAGNYQAEYSDTTRALGVAMAVLDGTGFALLNQSGQLAALQALLPPQLPVPTESYLVSWRNTLDDPAFASAFPEKIRSGLRVFERVFPLSR